MPPLKVALYGLNGHQIARALVDNPRARLVAAAGMTPDDLPEALRGDETVRWHDTLESILEAGEADLVSLCSPRRADQADEALRCMAAGMHVYAEKPCALNETDLDRLLEADAAGPARFREMGGSALVQPFRAMTGIVRSGVLGTVVQVFAQKSYPYHDRRPQDQAVDGGLTMQAGVHGMRWIEHVTGIRVAEVNAVETRVGNPSATGDLRMGSVVMMRLESGAVAALLCNYCNPRGLGTWGNEHLRVFGTEGFVEAVDGGTRTRLVVGEEDRGPLPPGEDLPAYHDLFFDALLGGDPMPMTLEEDLHPTRMIIRAGCTGCTGQH